MGRKVIDTVREIQREAPEGELGEDEVESLIKRIAGFDPRTVQKYWDALKEYGVLKENDDGTYRIKEPDTLNYEYSQFKDADMVTIYANIPRQLRDLADSTNISVQAIVNEALMDELGVRKSIIEAFCDEEVTDAEAKVVLRYVAQSLHKKGMDNVHERNTARAQIYADVMREQNDDWDGVDPGNNQGDAEKLKECWDRSEELQPVALKTAKVFDLA